MNVDSGQYTSEKRKVKLKLVLNIKSNIFTTKSSNNVKKSDKIQKNKKIKINPSFYSILVYLKASRFLQSWHMLFVGVLCIPKC